MGIKFVLIICILALAFRAQAEDPVFSGTVKNSLNAKRQKAAPSDGYDRVALHTPYGRIILKLLAENAPEAVATVKKHAVEERCRKCNFYRAEARPPVQSPEGPPYGLLQGELDLPSIPKHEGTLQVKAGYVAFIPQTTDFFIALVDHPEWGTSHTVFAEIEDFVSTDLIAIQWVHEMKHPEFGTVMRMMDVPVPFTINTQLTDPFAF